MNRKFQAFVICAALSAALSACGGQDSLGPKEKAPSGVQGSSVEGQDSGIGSKGTKADSGASKEESGAKESGGGTEDMEPLLGPDATDEELLELLKDETTVVSDADYIATLRSFQEETNDHVGQLYQIEGSYVVEGGTPYLGRTVVDGERRKPCRIPLKYVMEEPEEGAWIRVTGILNRGEVGGKIVPLLEVTVLQLPDAPGQEEIPAQ